MPARPSKLPQLTLLLASLACNITALFLPFIILRKGIDRDPYTLPLSVEMLWNKDLYLLAILVVGFSILFPFAKLAILITHTLFPENPTATRWHDRVVFLGKWSMLDPLLVSIILSLASKQLFVGARPDLGLPLFTLAIILSMFASERSHKTSPLAPSPKPTVTSNYSLFLHLLAGAALAATFFLPFLRIDDWLLKNHAYSIAALVPALWIQKAWIPSSTAAIFLIGLPVLAWTIRLLALLKLKSPTPNIQHPFYSIAQRWTMLDVFGLALVIFALESDHLMSTEISWGALALATYLLLTHLAQRPKLLPQP